MKVSRADPPVPDKKRHGVRVEAPDPDDPAYVPPRRIYLGVDPGASGGLAMVASYDMLPRGEPTYSMKMPDTEGDTWQWFSWVKRELLGSVVAEEVESTAFAVIEKVGGYTKAGGEQPGSAAFKFGQSYGGLRMALVAAGIPFEEVTPQRWQRAMGVAPRDNKGGESKTSFKNRLKAKAQALFPREKVTLATADALLIAEYCRRWREGRL